MKGEGKGGIKCLQRQAPGLGGGKTGDIDHRNAHRCRVVYIVRLNLNHK